jgi:hypothetical protein
VIKEDLDLDFDPELVEELIEKAKDAKELEDSTIQPDPLGDYEAGIYFHTATWAGNVLTVRMRLAPTGKAPRDDLGALDVTVASTSVVALLPNGSLVNPQPETLPSVSFTGQIAEPWDAVAEGPPLPPADRIFEGQFVITFAGSAFPPAAEDPADQLTYRMTVEFTNWDGGFTDVSFLNTLRVDFVPTDAPGSPLFEWTLVTNNPCSANPWIVSDGGKTIRYNFADSADCGGSCSAIQQGSASAIIAPSSLTRTLVFNIVGLVEHQNGEFDFAFLDIDDGAGGETRLISSQGRELAKECAMGEPDVTYESGQTFELLPDTSYTLIFSVDTADGNYHKSAFYELELDITEA